MHLAVFGGTGYLGSQIVKTALKSGFKVSVVTRGTYSPIALPGAEIVSADIFNASSYKHVLEEADAVVHSVGSIMNNSEYKKLANEPLTASSLLKLAQLRFSGNNPLESSTFEKLNYQSAAIVAEELAKIPQKDDKRKPFVYISAENWNRLADEEYIATKRHAEQAVASHKTLRPILIRPGFLYDKFDSCVGWPTFKSSISLAMGLWDSVGGDAPRISRQTVSKAVIEAINDTDIEGVVSNAALRKFERMEFEKS